MYDSRDKLQKVAIHCNVCSVRRSTVYCWEQQFSPNNSKNDTDRIQNSVGEWKKYHKSYITTNVHDLNVEICILRQLLSIVHIIFIFKRSNEQNDRPRRISDFHSSLVYFIEPQHTEWTGLYIRIATLYRQTKRWSPLQIILCTLTYISGTALVWIHGI